MGTVEPEVSVALTLADASRTPERVRQVEEIAARLGLRLVHGGRATLSFRAPASVVAEVFGTEPLARPARPPGDFDFGSAAGHAVRREARIPDELAGHVRAVSIAPPAVRLSASPPPDEEASDGPEEGHEG